MARKVRRPAPNLPAPRKPLWPLFLLTSALSAALGSGITYLALRPQIIQAKAAQSLTGQTALSVANAAFDAKDWPKAIDFYQQALQAGQGTPDVRTDLGTAYRNVQQPQKALEQYGAAQKSDPNHQNSLLNMGIVYAYDLKDTAKATQIWQSYLTRFPNGPHTADVKRLLSSLKSPAAPSP